jgi:hypothetical protein
VEDLAALLSWDRGINYYYVLDKVVLIAANIVEVASPEINLHGMAAHHARE